MTRVLRQAVPSGAQGLGLLRGQSITQILKLPVLAGSVVLAGSRGLDRTVERLNIMEVPDILPWVRPDELLLTTGYPLRDHPERLSDLVEALAERELSGIAIKLGRYLHSLPQAMLQAADEFDFPIIRLPDDVAFTDVLNHVLTEILNKQAKLLSRSEEIHAAFLDIVLSGGGLSEIAYKIAELVSGATFIIDSNARIVEAAQPPDGSVRCTPEATENLGGDGRERLSVPISAGGQGYGEIVVLEGSRSFQADDRLVLEDAATVAALDMVKANEVAAVESKFQADFLYELLRGRAGRKEEALDRATALSWALDRRLHVMVIKPRAGGLNVCFDSPSKRASWTAAMWQALKSRDPGAAVVAFGEEVVLITGPPACDGRESARQLAASVLAEVGGDDAGQELVLGLGRAVEDILAVPRAYAEASQAADLGSGIEGLGCVVHFNDLGAYRLLTQISDFTELRHFAAEVLGELASDDKRSRDLRQTLEVLLDANGNVAEAARRLHFHYNTLRYRIDRLEEILGCFMTDARARLNIHMALLILRMREFQDPAARPPRPGG